MSDNPSFLSIIQTSFREFIKSGTSRSTAKPKTLHGAIASDIASRSGSEYIVCGRRGCQEDKEHKTDGRYTGKTVDITIED